MSEQGSNLPPGEMTAHGGVAYTSYGLSAPARLLMPAYHHFGQPGRTQTVTLGGGDDAPRFTRRSWDACGQGCHEAGTSVSLSVPCDAMPHCQSCECGDKHLYILSGEKIARLRELLP